MNLFRMLRLSKFWLVVGLFLAPTVFAAERVKEYTYDALGRLTFTEDSKNGNRDYDYDEAGNRLNVAVGNADDEDSEPVE